VVRSPLNTKENKMDTFEKFAAKHILKEKLAKLRVSDIEDVLDMYLPDKEETKVRKLIKERMAKSFSLRHPVLTGIPTLGIAPAVAKQNAIRKIVRRMARGSSKLRNQMETNRRLRHKERLESIKADQPTRAASALGSSGVQIAALMAAAKSRASRDRDLD
jgi:hypothetical protein